MLKRHAKSRVLPGAWVFPGGRVDPQDGTVHESIHVPQEAASLFGQVGLDARAMLTAGARECFEEAGLWLGPSPVDPDWRPRIHGGTHSLIDLLEATDQSLDLKRLVPWSRWVTPKILPRRFDTMFLLVRIEDHAVYEADGIETTEHAWFDPAVAAQDPNIVAPPTWWSLVELARAGGVDALFQHASSRQLRPIEPIFSEHGTLLPGHPDHHEPALPGIPTRLVRTTSGWSEG